MTPNKFPKKATTARRPSFDDNLDKIRSGVHGEGAWMVSF